MSRGSPADYDFLLVECDENGALQWCNRWGEPASGQVNAIALDSDSNLIIAGRYDLGGTILEYRSYLAKIRIDYSPDNYRRNSTAALAANCWLPAFPNPFNSATTVSFTLLHRARARLAVYDVLGREVRVLADEDYASGEHRFTFDASGLPSGIYFAHVQSGEFTATQKLLLLK